MAGVRLSRQLPRPVRLVDIVQGDDVQRLSPDEVSPDLVGLKALGLLRLPQAWVPPFFVVSSTDPPTTVAIKAAAKAAGIAPDEEVLVRSSGTLEGMDERGSLETSRCYLDEVGTTISCLQTHPSFIAQKAKQKVHFVVQKRVSTRKLGHLANERRLQRHPRDWTFEVEGGSGISHAIGVRRWRNAADPRLTPLACSAAILIAGALRSVAAWAHPHRAHIEWVWDGKIVWVVQLDYLGKAAKGVQPRDLVSIVARPNIAADELKLFVPATAESLSDYPKLKNARLYAELGYYMPTFYVLCDREIISDLLLQGTVHDNLRNDLATLCEYPFVLRTDAAGLQADQRQMLPRSDELRTVGSAIMWLQGIFKEAMQPLSDARDIVLIGHHYIPAIASAWSLASPKDRRVRIESLWGIPEGLYCFAHDVFEVDTMHSDIERGNRDDAAILFSRERYKGKFIAPNRDGEWIVQQTAEGPDWSRSIQRDSWVKEIAWTSRRIADKVGHDVVVMWFIGVPDSQGLQAVMPWYHEEWSPTSTGYKKAAPRIKRISSQIRKVSNQEDWLSLKEDVAGGIRVERVVVDPSDSSIVRARDFVKDLASHAKKHDYVVELGGGLLSHFFYMLSKAGCNVECVDLVGVSEESVEFNKIVRDKIPEDIQRRGESVDVIELRGDALIEGLRRKLIEEAFEVADATSVEDMADELADVAEVLDALLHASQITDEDIRERKLRKRDKRGGFDQGLMLVKTALPPTLRGEVGEQKGLPQQNRVLSEINELPAHDVDFHVDQRFDASGARERQLTLTLAANEQGYSAGEHMFDLATPGGIPHRMYFNARLDRAGSILRLKMRLTNAAVQLELPFQEDDGARKSDSSSE